eukprot:667718-Rhodomonas_salina.1
MGQDGTSDHVTGGSSHVTGGGGHVTGGGTVSAKLSLLAVAYHNIGVQGAMLLRTIAWEWKGAEHNAAKNSVETNAALSTVLRSIAWERAGTNAESEYNGGSRSTCTGWRRRWRRIARGFTSPSGAAARL